MCTLGQNILISKVIVICTIPLLNHEIITGFGGPYLNMSMHYLKIEVAKYMASSLRIFKIAHQIQPSPDLITKYKWLSSLNSNFSEWKFFYLVKSFQFSQIFVPIVNCGWGSAAAGLPQRRIPPGANLTFPCHTKWSLSWFPQEMNK